MPLYVKVRKPDMSNYDLAMDVEGGDVFGEERRKIIYRKYIEELKSLLEQEDVVDTRLKYSVVNGVCEASPVLMSLVLGAYDLTRQFVEKGYSLVSTECEAWKSMTPPEVLSFKEWSEFDCVEESVQKIILYDLQGTLNEYSGRKEISLGQYLFFDEELPEELRIYLLEQIGRELQESRECNGEVVSFVLDVRGFKWEALPERLTQHMPREDIVTQYLAGLKWIKRHNAGLLKLLFNSTWWSFYNISSGFFEEPQIELAEFALEHMLTEQEDYLQLLQFIGMSCKGDEGNWGNWDVEFFGRVCRFAKGWTTFYKRIASYYVEEKMREELFGAVLWDCMQVYCGRKGEFAVITKEERRYEKEILAFLKKIMPQRLKMKEQLIPSDNIHMILKWYCEYKWNFNGFSSFGRLTESLCLERLFCFCQQELGISIVLDNFCGALDGCDKILNQFIHPSSDCITDDDMNWIRYVDAFDFHGNRKLNSMQKYVLDYGNNDILQEALEKGLLKGKHLERAIEYCMEQEKLHVMLPCLMAYQMPFIAE